MFRLLLVLILACAGCGSNEQPDWARAAVAYEVPLPSPEDKADFADLLSTTALANGYHADIASPSELAAQSSVSSISFNAAVWRGKNDQEAIVSAQDFEDHLGKVWLTFSVGQNPERVLQFRQILMPKIMKRWPDTLALPIMPTGAIPLPDDLIRTPAGYIVKPSSAEKYELKSH